MYKNLLQRFKQIVKILASYGFGYIVDSKLNNNVEKSPENLRKAFEELGSTFIKIGQILSTRPDILPKPYIDELSKLQNNVPQESIEDINTVFMSELNASIHDIFKEFDEVPFASASIAQVHCAVLKDGRDVIVKIQRPEIADNIRMDIYILYKILLLTKAKFSDSLIDPKEALDELTLSTEEELDFNIEASNLLKFKDNNSEVAFIYVPYLVKELCSAKILVMERINGFKIDDIPALRTNGYDLEDIGKKLALSFFKQVFKDGIFHGDPHPGNLLIREGKICFIDFGITGSLSSSLKATLNEAILSIVYHDINKMISVLMTIGIKKGPINKNTLYEDINYVFDSYLSTSLESIKISAILQDIFEMAKRNNIRLPKELTLLIKTIVIVEGVIAKLSPDIKLLDIAIPYVKSNNKLAFFKEINFDELLIKGHIFLKSCTQLPSKFIELSDSLINGRAKIQLEHMGLEKTTNDLNKMVNRIIFGVVVSSMILASSTVLNSNIGPKINGISVVGILGFGFAGIMGIWLLISILKSGKM